MTVETFGEFWSTLLEGGRALRIDRADPRIRITRQLLMLMLASPDNPFADLRPGPDAAHCHLLADVDDWPKPLSYQLEGWLLTIHAINGSPLYRIGAYHPGAHHPEHDWYEAEFPD